MKTFKILFAAIIIAGFATSAMAQTADIEAKAEVMSPIEITGLTDLNFSLVAQGIAKSIDLVDEVSGGAAQGDETTGIFQVEAATGSNVSWEFSVLPSALDRDGGSETMPITYVAGWSNVNDGDGTGMQNEGAITQGNGYTVNEVVDGEFFVFLGGEVTPAAGQEAGVYTADVTLTAEYN
jgi:hypothetical protein